MKRNVPFLDKAGSVIARLKGYDAVMDASLLRSFKSQYAAAE